MTTEQSPVRLPHDPFWRHHRVRTAGGMNLHVVRQGTGTPVLLLHGWPGFWFDWRRVIPALAEHHDVIAPDFRGYGRSDRPDLPPAEGYGAEIFARDMMELLDALAIPSAVVVGHDIGATVAQALARAFPERVLALVLLNPPYPGIGERRFEPSAQREFWYQHLHQLPLADELVGRDRWSVAAYLGHFYRHWTGNAAALLPAEFEAIVDAYAEPGAFPASIAYYRARAAQKSAPATAPVTPIPHRTMVLWGEADPVIPVRWADRLDRTFSDVTLRTLPGIGHFTAFEAPQAVLEAVAAIVAPPLAASIS